MRKILKNKVYDTKTATLMGKRGNALDDADPEYLYEALYRKRTGEYFLHGQGGELTKYAKQMGDEKKGSEKIIPLSFEQARDWAKDRLSPEEYEAAFGTCEEDGSVTQLATWIPKSLYNWLERQRSMQSKPMQDLVTEAIKYYLEKYGEEVKE